MCRKFLLIFFLLFIGLRVLSQMIACTTLGQNPSTAFPVCGLDTFKQTQVPMCGGKIIPVPDCGDIDYVDANPFWYRITCYQSGTLGFSIIPENLNDDYDWQLFDITDHQFDEVYTNASLFVTGNWSGSSGTTGTSANSRNVISCASNPRDNVSTFSETPDIFIGHTYLLMISHYSGSGQSGYNLSFGGGTASIVDTLKPAMVSATAICAGQTINVAINKKVKCKSLAADGSDFEISPSNAKVISATGFNCDNSFDMDSLTITLDHELDPGLYNVIIKNGKDINTLLDNCDNNITPNSSVPVIVYAVTPTPLDSITPVQCAPDTLQLVFKKRMLCSTVAANGSDFKLSGSSAINVSKAFGDVCVNGLSNIIKLVLDKPIQTGGIYTLLLQKGTDNNTIFDECSQETPAGSTINFLAADTVSAAFNYSLHLGCVFDTLYYLNDGRNGINTWNWMFDFNGTGTAADSLFLFNDYGNKHITLNVSNGVCSDSSSANILLDNQLISRFNVTPAALCPEDAAKFTDSSIGKIISWYWIFGDGTYSNIQNPSPKYYPQPPTQDGRTYPATLIVKNNIGCYDTAQQFIQVHYNCYIAVPSAFTPNGDGLNDYLYPLNAYKADNLELRVYNRWGQLVYATKDWTKKWDGTINGNRQPAGTYVWMLQYINHDSGKPFFLKGTTVLIR